MDGQACFATARNDGRLTLDADQAVTAGGPNYVSAPCRAIHLKLTSATYRTYARSCLETASGAATISCSRWVLLSYPDTWDTLSTSVQAGARWRLEMYGLGPEEVRFSYTG